MIQGSQYDYKYYIMLFMIQGSHDDKNRGMAAFLHPQQLWRWSSSGARRPRSRRIVHQEIEREEDESLSVGDCAVFLSTGRPDRPYVGRIEALWESAGGHMRVKVRWFYHAVETEGCANGGRRVDELTMPVRLCGNCCSFKVRPPEKVLPWSLQATVYDTQYRPPG